MKISFIIPVYNCERFLDKCINSCLVKNIDYEIIAINDGSTDGSLTILNNYAGKTRNFYVINQNNQKQGAARNRGLERARGEYIWFVDADDWIINENVCDLIKLLDKYNLDILRLDAIDFYPKSSSSKKRKCHHKPNTIYEGNKVLLENKFNVCVPFHLFKKEFLLKNKLFFLEGIFYEDNEFMLRVFSENPRFYFLPKLSYSVYHSDNSSTRNNNFERKLDLIQVAHSFSKLFNEKSLNKNEKEIYSVHFARAINNFLYKTRDCKEVFELGLLKILEISNLNEIYKFNKSILHQLEKQLLRAPVVLRVFIKMYYKLNG